MVDIEKPFYSENQQIRTNFPDFKSNVEKTLALARHRKIKVVHVRAVYNEEKSPWISNFRKMNPNKWDWYVKKF